MILLPFILHHANRQTKSPDFYKIKDAILKKYGKLVDYDIQHIPGKKCWTCDGTGEHVKYSWNPPYKAYDWDYCWHCNGTGYYKLPQWICLSRIQFGKYTFHRPLKREYMVKNPFVHEVLGFELSPSKIIEGYIEHEESRFSHICLLLLYRIYNIEAYNKELIEFRWKFKYRVVVPWKIRINRFFTWEGIVLEKPHQFVKHWMNAKGEYSKVDPDLPF